MSTYTFREYQIPELSMQSIVLYIERGILPGKFLQAVICNDLSTAVWTADDVNVANLPAYVSYFNLMAPGMCWGSPARMKAWIEKHCAVEP